MVRLLGRTGIRSARRPGGPSTPSAQNRAHRASVPDARPAPRRPPTGHRRNADGARLEPFAGLHRALGGRSVAGQVFVLQVVIVLLLVVTAVAALLLQVRHDTTQEARNRSLAVAQAFAHAPGTREALTSPDPTAVLRAPAEAARAAAKVDFIVVMNTDGIRYTHPKPDRI